MTRTIRGAAACLLAALALTSMPTRAQEKEQMPAQPTPEEMQQMMKRWQDASTPGENHKKLAQFLGTWNTSTKYMMSESGGPPQSPTPGTAEIKWLVEGRWLRHESKGTLMGMPYAGYGTMGYDNFKQHYVQSWVDNYTTTLLTGEGAWDQTGKTLILYGFLDEPMTGENDKTVKYVYRMTGPDRFTFELHDMMIGETNTKVMEMEYTRVKK
jgi:hypothetical protein